jgi:hypothetical protein
MNADSSLMETPALQRALQTTVLQYLMQVLGWPEPNLRVVCDAGNGGPIAAWPRGRIAGFRSGVAQRVELDARARQLTP